MPHFKSINFHGIEWVCRVRFPILLVNISISNMKESRINIQCSGPYYFLMLGCFVLDNSLGNENEHFPYIACMLFDTS